MILLSICLAMSKLHKKCLSWPHFTPKQNSVVMLLSRCPGTLIDFRVSIYKYPFLPGSRPRFLTRSSPPSKKKSPRIASKGFSPSEVGTRSSTIVRPHIASVEQRISRRQSFDYLPIIHADFRDGATDESERF